MGRWTEASGRNRRAAAEAGATWVLKLRCGPLALCLAGWAMLVAQRADAQAWPTYEFELIAVDETTISSPLLAGAAEVHETLAMFGLDPTTVGSFELPQSTRDEIEEFLSYTARALDDWGFVAPDLYRPVTALGKYRVFIVDALEDASGVYRHLYNWCHSSKVIFLSAGSILEGGELHDRGRQTVAHELFHAVQGNSPFFQGDCSDWPGDWIGEGTARAVGWDMVRRINYGSVPFLAGFEPWGARSYSHLLAIPFRENTPVSPYPTASFWRYLGEYHGSSTFQPGPGKDEPIDYRYLARLFASPPVGGGCRAANTPCTREARWLDSQLRSLMGVSLRELYTRFIGTYALYGGHRAAGVTPPTNARRWREASFEEGCHDVTIKESLKTIEQTSRIRTLQQMAAQCWALTLEGFGRDVNVLAIVEGSEGPRNFSDLSAIASNDTEDTAVPQVAEPQRAKPLTDTESGQPFAEFVFGHPDGTSWFFLTNMGDDPATARQMNNLRVRFLPLEGWAYMGSSAGGGGPSAAEIDAPLPIELDQIRQAYVQGNEGLCTLQLSFSNSGSPEELGVRLDLQPPIKRGDYPIFHEPARGKRSVHWTALSIDFLEENPGLAMVGFDVDLGLPPEHLEYNGYVGRAGTVTLEHVSPHLIRGRVDVSGELICMPSIEQPECLGPPGVRAEAVFSVLPTGMPSSRPPTAGCFVKADEPQPTSAIGGSGGTSGGPAPGGSPPTPPDPTSSSPGGGTPPPEGATSTDGAAAGAPVTGSDPESAAGGAGEGAPSPTDPATAGAAGTTESFANQLSIRVLDGAPPAGGSDEGITITGGCNGSSALSLVLHRGQRQGDDWLSLAFETDDPVGTGDTGEFDVDIQWDRGSIVPDNLPPGTNVRVPDRYTGRGMLTLRRHDAVPGQQRMTGTVESDAMTNRSGTRARLAAEFDIDRSCGVVR